MTFILGCFAGLLVGIVLTSWKKYNKTTDDECQCCRRSYQEYIDDLEKKVHGMRSSNGKLGKELQNMSFMKDGYKPR